MEQKTPKFDNLINKVLENLVPGKRNCRWKGKHKHCEGEFKIEAEDIKFFRTFKVPPPNYCPTCRRMSIF